MGAGLVCAFLLSMPAAAQRAPRTIAPTPAPDGQSAPRETAPRVIPPTPEGGPGPGQGERPQRSHPTGPTVGKIVVEGTQRIDPTTVRSYMAIKEGDVLDPDALNQSLKTLFAPGARKSVAEGKNVYI